MAAFSRVESEFGGVDVLVNNAGVADTEKFIGNIINYFITLSNNNCLVNNAGAVDTEQFIGNYQLL